MDEPRTRRQGDGGGGHLRRVGGLGLGAVSAVRLFAGEMDREREALLV